MHSMSRARSFLSPSTDTHKFSSVKRPLLSYFSVSQTRTAIIAGAEPMPRVTGHRPAQTQCTDARASFLAQSIQTAAAFSRCSNSEEDVATLAFKT